MAWASISGKQIRKKKPLIFLKSFFMDRAYPLVAINPNLKFLVTQNTSYKEKFFDYRKYNT
jgi:hypothetical protein